MPNSDLTRRTFVGAAAAAGLKAVNGELVADGPRRSTGAATESVWRSR